MLIGLDGNEANVENRVGSGVYAFELLKELSKNTKHSFVIYLKEKPLPDLPKESPNFNYKIFGPKKFWTQFALPIRLAFGKKVDVFFSMGHYGPRFSKVPYIVTIFDLSYLHFPEMFKKGDLYQLTNWSKYSIQKADHVIAISKSTKDDIVKSYDIEPSKINVTYMGFDDKRFKPQTKIRTDPIRKKFKIKGGYIIFVGTLQPRKNIERLIEAFSIIKPTFNDVSLVIVGRKGWLYESILNKSKILKVDKNVIFTDFVTKDELPRLISSAKAFALPSLWEGFGIPVIEAQACGVPVVVSNTSSLPEIVGDSGILVDPNSVGSIANGIEKSLNPATRSILVKKGYRNIRRFSWKKCANETLAILEKVASKS